MLKIINLIIDENEILYVQKQVNSLEVMFKNGETKVFNFTTIEGTDEVFEELFETLQYKNRKKVSDL